MKLSQRVQALAESATLAVTAQAARMKAEGIDVISFGAGEPDFDTPDHIRNAAIEAIRAGHTGYSKPASGLLQAKEAVCTKLARENGLSYSPEQTIITAGGKMALALAIQAMVDPGDEVIIPAPYWVSYPEMVKLAGGVPVFVHGPEENDYRLRPQDLEKAITEKTALFCPNSPSNPSGVTYSPQEVQELAGVVHGTRVMLMSDEIYDRLLYDGQRTMSYAAVSDDAYQRTLTVNSASKTYAMTGWRLGYAAGPVDVIRAMAKLQSQSTSGAVTFNQIALVEALTGPQDCVERMRQKFEVRGGHMWKRLQAMPGVRCPRPTGAFYCFPNVSGCYGPLGVQGSLAFSARLLEEAQVAVVPGLAFGLNAHVRFSFASSLEEIDKGLDRMEAWLGDVFGQESR